MKRDFPVQNLNKMEDTVHVRSITQDRKAWSRFLDVVCRGTEEAT